MARPKRVGLAYYPRDTDFFQDRKIRNLIGKYGCDAVCMYEYLLDTIYYDKGYYAVWDSDLEDTLTTDLHLQKETSVNQILNYLLKRSLFDDTLFKSVKVLTGESIQKRYQSAKAKMSCQTEVNADYWLLSEEQTLSCIKVTQNSDKNAENPDKNAENPDKNAENSIKEKKGKEKKGKENINIYSDIPFEIQNAWAEYLEMRKEIKKPATEKAQKMALNRLNSLAPNDYKLQAEILNQSVFYSWTGLYALKDNGEEVKNGDDYKSFVPSRRGTGK